MSSKIITDLAVDPAIQLDSNYRFGPTDRRYLDDQARGAQTHLVNCVVGGDTSTYYTVHSSSPDIAVGDAVCAKEGKFVTKAMGEDLSNAGRIVGIAKNAGLAGSRLTVSMQGVLPSSVTGLSPSIVPSVVYVDPDTGRLTLSESDFTVGSMASDGTLALATGSIPGATGAALRVKKNGTLLPQHPSLNFVGNEFAIADNSGGSTTDLNLHSHVSVRAHGADGDVNHSALTAVLPQDAAIHSAFDTACSADDDTIATLYFPPVRMNDNEYSTYHIDTPLRVKRPNLIIDGGSQHGSFLNSTFKGPAIIVSKDDTDTVPLVSALLPPAAGQPSGQAWQMNQTRFLIFSDYQAFELDGREALTVEFFAQLNTAVTGAGIASIGINSGGKIADDDDLVTPRHIAMSFTLNGADLGGVESQLRVHLALSDGDVDLVNPLPMTTGVIYHIALDYDGTTVRLYVSPVTDMTSTLAASSAGSGTVVWHPLETIALTALPGGMFSAGSGSSIFDCADAIIDAIRVSYISRYFAGPFTTPTTKWQPIGDDDAHFILNFDNVYEGDIIVGLSERVAIYFPLGVAGAEFGQGGVTIRNLTITCSHPRGGCSIFMQAVVGARLEKLNVSGYIGLLLRNNCFNSTVTDINASGSSDSLANIADLGAGNSNMYDTLKLQTANYPLILLNGSPQVVRNVYLGNWRRFGAVLYGGLISLDSFTVTFEGRSTPGDGGILVGGLFGQINMKSSVIDSRWIPGGGDDTVHSSPPVVISGGAHHTFDGCYFNGLTATSEEIQIRNRPTHPVVVRNGTKEDGSPWSLRPEFVIDETTGARHVLTQQDWYVDDALGAETGDGSEAYPLTWKAFRRLVSGATFDPPTNPLNVIVGTLTDAIEFDSLLDMANSKVALIKGTRTVLHSGTVTDVTAKDRDAKIERGIEDTALGDADAWSEWVGKEVLNVATGARAMITKNLGTYKCELSQWCDDGDGSLIDAITQPQADIGIGDSYQVLDYTEAVLGSRVVFGYQKLAGEFPGGVIFSQLRFTDYVNAPSIAGDSNALVAFTHCIFDHGGNMTGSNITVAGCCWRSALTTDAGTTTIVHGACASNSSDYPGGARIGRAAFFKCDGDTVFQGSGDNPADVQVFGQAIFGPTAFHDTIHCVVANQGGIIRFDAFSPVFGENGHTPVSCSNNGGYFEMDQQSTIAFSHATASPETVKLPAIESPDGALGACFSIHTDSQKNTTMGFAWKEAGGHGVATVASVENLAVAEGSGGFEVSDESIDFGGGEGIVRRWANIQFPAGGARVTWRSAVYTPPDP